MFQGDIINEEQYMPNISAYLKRMQLRANGICIINTENVIHESAIIGAGVKMGKGNYVGANCYIVGNTVIGDNNHFEAFVSIGTFPEHREYFNNKQAMGVQIGDGNVFREFVTVNSGCTQNTIISNKCWLLKGSHVGHDSFIEDDVTLSCNALIGGYSTIMEGAIFGLGAVCHQYTLVGAHAMVGMGCVIPKRAQIHPFITYAGNPAKYLKPNNYKISKFTENDIANFASKYQQYQNEYK